MVPISKRVNILFMFDAVNSNPNGDPDRDNRPRTLPDGRGYVTSGCLKRKIRDAAVLYFPETKLYVTADSTLEQKHKSAYEAAGIEPKSKDDVTREDRSKVFKSACEMYWDVRTFGAMMNVTNTPIKVCRGPVQVSEAISFHPVAIMQPTITRCCYTNDKERDKSNGDTQMGSKWLLEYGLYYAKVNIDPCLADGLNGTCFSDEDLATLKKSIENMFEHDQSSSRLCNIRKIYMWTHESALGNAHQHELFESVLNRVQLASGVNKPTKFGDYVLPSESDLQTPNGVTLDILY